MADLIFFDCDGVLVDSEIMSTAVSVSIFTDNGIPMTHAQAHALFTGRSQAASVEFIRTTYGAEVADCYVAEHDLRLFELFRAELRAIDGVRDVLAQLRSPYCVTSNSARQRLAVTLSVTGLNRFFGRNVFSAEDVKQGKPAPDMFLLAASTFGVDPKNCIVIDDSPFGVAGGVAAGARVFGFCGGSHISPGDDAKLKAAGAESVFYSMDELRSALVQ